MSTIFGKVEYSGKNIPEQHLDIIQKRLNHWEADKAGIWNEGPVGLGHLMLYNTPESLSETLPLQIDHLIITADARIDNRDGICHDLGIKNEVTIPDSTLILTLYEKYGKHCVKHLIGDFAFTILDKKAGTLFCVRDHMGVKPFFYYTDDSCFAFASEKKGILAIPETDKTIDAQFLYNQFFRYSDQAVDTTLYKKIRRLAPAHTLTLDLSTKEMQIERYWDLDADIEIKFDTEQQYYDAFLEHFKTAVNCRLRTAYPIAAELSGGMDSSGITGVASAILKETGRELITISNTPALHETDQQKIDKSERKFIQAVVKFNNIKNAIITTEKPPAHVFEQHDQLDEMNDGPDSWRQLWPAPIREAAHEAGVRVLLSGFPGDEMVTYRGKYYMLDYLDKKQYLKYFFAKKKFWGFNKLEPFIPYSVRYRLHILKNNLGWYNKHIKPARRLFNIPKWAIVRKGDSSWLGHGKDRQYDSYRYYQKHRYLRNHVPARMECDTRLGLYYKLEPRFPMADIRLTQFYLSMPNYLKYQGTLNRTAYRKMLKDYLPAELLERDDKAGGMSPHRDAISEEQLKQKQELDKVMIDEMIASLENHPLLKKPVGKRGINIGIFRWLQKNPDIKLDR